MLQAVLPPARCPALPRLGRCDPPRQQLPAPDSCVAVKFAATGWHPLSGCSVVVKGLVDAELGP